jgi:hypothetical protein
MKASRTSRRPNSSPEAEHREAEWSERWGREGAEILLRSAPGVEAIFCGSDVKGEGPSAPGGTFAFGPSGA